MKRLLTLIVLGLSLALVGCTKTQLDQARAEKDKAIVASEKFDALVPVLPISDKEKAEIVEARAKMKVWADFISAIIDSKVLEVPEAAAPATQPSAANPDQ